jgi:PAS domain S-box-containing protein
MEHITPADVLKLLETVGESIWKRSLVTDEITVTEGIWTALGYPAAEIPRTLQEALPLFHPDDVDRILAELDKYLSGKVDDYRSQARVRASDGQWRWLRIVGGTISRGESGEPVSLGGVLTDITQEVRVQKSRALARERLAHLTVREQDVLAGLLQGLSSRQIADALGISVRTVESYRAKLLDKLKVRSVTLVVQLCAEAGWSRTFPPTAAADRRS